MPSIGFEPQRTAVDPRPTREGRPRAPHEGAWRPAEATGAPVPAGVDAVVMQEGCEVLDDGRVLVYSMSAEGLQAAKDCIDGITAEVEIAAREGAGPDTGRAAKLRGSRKVPGACRKAFRRAVPQLGGAPADPSGAQM